MRRGWPRVLVTRLVKMYFPGYSFHIHSEANYILQQWQRTVRSSQGGHLNSQNQPISSVKSLVRSAEDHVTTLEDLYDELEKGDRDEKGMLWEKVNEHKALLDDILCQFDRKRCQSVKCKLLKNRQKRLSAKRKKKLRDNECQAKMEACDKWYKQRQKEELRKRLEKSVEEQAGGTLNAVKKKTQDITNYSQLLKALKELREFRRSKQNFKNDLTEADVTFSTNCDLLEDILSKYTEVYKKEEHALRVMMSQQVDDALIKRTTNNKIVYTSLEDFYLTEDKEILEKRQKEWGSFLSFSGTQLPVEWVEPAPPSSNQWAWYLKKDNNNIQ